MCGRYNLEQTAEVDQILRQHGFSGEFRPAYNIAPTEFAPIIVQDRHRASEIIPARWWLTPSWSDGPTQKFAMFNARSENLTTSRAFKGPFEHKRCVVVASSFIEWRKEGSHKQAYDVAIEGQALAMAGIWDCWQDGDNLLYSFAIVTKPASHSFRDYHSRMPVLLRRSEVTQWIDPHRNGRDAVPLIDNAIGDGWCLNPLDSSVGNARNKSRPLPLPNQSLF